MASQIEWLALIEENESIYEETIDEPAYIFSGRTFYQFDDTGAYKSE